MSDGPHDSDSERPVPEHGAGDHLDHATLADLREGILESSAARAAENHLAGCEACAADDRALAAIPSLLAASGSVGPMPADVARRLDEALAAEPRIPVEAAATVTPLASRSADARQQVRGMRVLQAAAVLVVIMLGVGIAVGYGGGGGSSDDSGGAVSGAARDSAGQAEAGAGELPGHEQRAGLDEGHARRLGAGSDRRLAHPEGRVGSGRGLRVGRPGRRHVGRPARSPTCPGRTATAPLPGSAAAQRSRTA